jgi:SAM-dependent methyltransferase
MVQALKTSQPDISVRLGDIRDLSAFEDDSFDFVLGSNNVISAVGHADRLEALAEVHRVLRPGGTFIFSSHNRGYAEVGEGPRLELHRNPVTAIKDLLTYVRRQINHARVGPHRESHDEYALLDDTGHDFALLHYYVDRPHAERQLTDSGFLVRDVFNPMGQALPADALGVDAPFLLYVAEKVGLPALRASTVTKPTNHSKEAPHEPPLTRQPSKRPNKPSPAPSAER